MNKFYYYNDLKIIEASEMYFFSKLEHKYVLVLTGGSKNIHKHLPEKSITDDYILLLNDRVYKIRMRYEYQATNPDSIIITLLTKVPLTTKSQDVLSNIRKQKIKRILFEI